MEECQYRSDWPKWKNVIHAELNSPVKGKVFGPIVLTTKDVKPIGCKWIFIKK